MWKEMAVLFYVCLRAWNFCWNLKGPVDSYWRSFADQVSSSSHCQGYWFLVIGTCKICLVPWPEKQWKTLPLKSLARKTKITHHLCCETVLSSSWKHAWQSKLFVSLDLEPYQVKVLTTEKDEAKCRLKSGRSPFKNRKRNWRTNWMLYRGRYG